MRIALGLSYDGGSFEGWQSQPSKNTVHEPEARMPTFSSGFPRMNPFASVGTRNALMPLLP